VNQIIEDMLRACVLNDGPRWDRHLSLPEFSYNNNYQESLKMSPFKALYGRSCRTPLSWSEFRERTIFGPDMVIEAGEKVKQIRANILIAQSHQKSYTIKRRGIPWSLRSVIMYTYEFLHQAGCEALVSSELVMFSSLPLSLLKLQTFHV
jgi:hypothetical protein